VIDKAIYSGILEGLTEFIPVSSTGHLILLGHLIGFEGELAETFDIFIQLGAILAVVVLFFKRFMDLLNFSDGQKISEGMQGKAGIAKLGLACLPAFVLGAAFHHAIKEKLFNSPSVACALILGGIAMVLLEKLHRAPLVTRLEDITLKQSFLIGIFQCFALWPGMSRSGSTIIGGMILRLEREVAAQFSFLVAVPVMFAAVGFDMLKSVKLLSTAHIPLFATGFVVAFVVSIFAIKFFLSLLNRLTLKPFGIYRILLGLIVIYFWAGK